MRLFPEIDGVIGDGDRTLFITLIFDLMTVSATFPLGLPAIAGHFGLKRPGTPVGGYQGRKRAGAPAGGYQGLGLAGAPAGGSAGRE